jgi:hypothetical protein
LNKKGLKSLIFILVVFSLFPLSYFYRKNISDDIRDHSLYTIGKVIAVTGSLKSGDAWKYKFLYRNTEYTGFRSTHVDYQISPGNFVVINFSEKDPTHSLLIYEYRIKPDSGKYYGTVWKRLPDNFLISTTN